VKLERLRDLLVPVLENPRQAGELHWTGVKIHGFLNEQLGLEVGYSTTVRYLHELGYNLRVPRPWPERQNEAERKAFLDQLRLWQEDPNLESWFADECGVRVRGGAGALGAAGPKCLCGFQTPTAHR
jgi:Winged helix-turn helix